MIDVNAKKMKKLDNQQRCNTHNYQGFYKNNTVKRVPIKCAVCGKVLYVLPCRAKKRKYCNEICSETKNKERSNMAAKKIAEDLLKLNKLIIIDFFDIFDTIDFNTIKFNKLQETFWNKFKLLFKKYDIKDVRTLIYKITMKHDICSRTFVTSLRGHRNGVKPFWFNETK